MQRSLHLVLPRQCVHKLMQTDGDLDGGQGLPVIIEELEIGDETEGIGHGHDTWLQSDPVPGNAGGLRFTFVAPQSLAGAWVGVVAEVQHSGAQVRQVQLRRTTGLPQ